MTDGRDGADPTSAYASARSQVAAATAGTVSARELLEAHLGRIEAANPVVNALVSLDPERARATAAAADEAHARSRRTGEPLGALHGAVVAVKDTHRLAGWRTTYGSRTREHHVPTSDDLHVARVLAAGAVVVGRSNVPEHAAGSHTYNELFGTTLNPWDVTRSAGGSSGGAAAALATGMVALADGSDMGGSLRNPASFCGVVGMRPGLGTVPLWPTWNPFETVNVHGPLARDVGDLALLLSVQAGPDPRVPSASAVPGSTYAPPLGRAGLPPSLAGVRVALSVDLGGAYAVDPQVAAVVRAQADVLAGAGARVVEAHPDLTGADEVFRTLRAWLLHATLGDLHAEHPGVLKASLAANIELGARLSGPDVARAHRLRTALVERVRGFFADHDVLATPVSQVPPFPADQEYPHEVDGRVQPDYLAWMRSAYLISATGCPAVSVPAGLTREGWPVGLQLVGPHGSERRLLEVAAAYEAVSPVRGLHPPPLPPPAPLA